MESTWPTAVTLKASVEKSCVKVAPICSSYPGDAPGWAPSPPAAGPTEPGPTGLGSAIVGAAWAWSARDAWKGVSSRRPATSKANASLPHDPDWVGADICWRRWATPRLKIAASCGGQVIIRAERRQTGATLAERAGIEVRVRRATPRDLEGYARVVQSVAAEGRYLFIERVTEKKRRSMAELLKDRACLVLAAEARERGRWKMVGSLALSRYGDASKSGHVRVLAMMVVDGYRGMGIGKRLMEEGLEWARAAEGVEKVALGVFSNNGRAYRLYESFGFKVEGVRRRHYYIMGKPEDEVDMALFVK